MWRQRGKRRVGRERAALEEERAALEERCGGLVGDAVTSVAYVEMEYDEPMWNLTEDYDSVDHGVELRLSSGRMVALLWDHAIVDFGMRMVEGNVTVIEGVPRLDVSTTSRWSSLIGRTITRCRVLWKPDEDDDYIDCLPQTIRLDFEGGRRVFVTASDVDRDFSWGADHVSVFFDDAWERRSDLTHDIHPSLD